MNKYIGNRLQISGVQEMRLVGGKGDGQRIYEISNGKGLELKVSPDRNGDITQLKYKGVNCSYMSPCGYVAPAYYEGTGTGWLKSFTAGFLTTCGLQSVGGPCVDNGEELPLHGSIANQPCLHSYWNEDDENIYIHTVTSDEVIFGRKLVLYRTIAISKDTNSFRICDEIENTGDRTEPVEILYHMNIGYPLLDEDSSLVIPSAKVIPRDDNARSGLSDWMKIEKPQSGFQEQCFYHSFEGDRAEVSIYQPKTDTKLIISADPGELDGFVEWKMMGVRDYVLGLEFGNCYPDGRDVMREKGMLKFIAPEEKKSYHLEVRLLPHFPEI